MPCYSSGLEKLLLFKGAFCYDLLENIYITFEVNFGRSTILLSNYKTKKTTPASIPRVQKKKTLRLFCTVVFVYVPCRHRFVANITHMPLIKLGLHSPFFPSISISPSGLLDRALPSEPLPSSPWRHVDRLCSIFAVVAPILFIEALLWEPYPFLSGLAAVIDQHVLIPVCIDSGQRKRWPAVRDV